MECPVCLETIEHPRRQCMVCGSSLHLTGWREAEPLPPAEDLQPAGAENIAQPATIPLIGRQSELKSLRAALTAPVAERSRLILVQGPAGVGKSRLVDEALAGLAAPPRRIDWSAVSHGPNITFGPPFKWIQQLAGIGPRLAPAQVDARLEELARATAELEQTDAIYLKAALGTPAGMAASRGLAAENIRRNVHRILGRLIASQADHTGVCLVVDHAHWLDDASGEWLNAALDGLGGDGLTIIALTRDAASGWRPAAPPGLSITLGPLTAGERGELFDQLAPALDFLPELRRHVIEQDVGTPLFIQELSRLVARVMAENAGPLEPDQVARIVEIVPLSLEELIGRRLLQMDDHSQRLLMVAALLGPDCSLGLLECFDQIRDGLEGRLRALEGRRVIELYNHKNGPRVRFVEGYVRELAYETMPEDQRRALHAQVASVMEKFYGQDLNEHLDTLAWHWSRAGEVDRALSCQIRAADRRCRLGEYRSAIECYRKALDDLRELEPSTINKTRLIRTMVQLARLLRLTGKADEGGELIEAADALIEQIGNENLYLLARLERGVALLRRGENQEAQAVLRPLRETARRIGNPSAECTVLNALGVIDLHAGRYEMALASFRELAEKAQKLRITDLEADALNNTGLIYWRWGQYAEAAKAFRAASALRLRSGDRFGLVAALLNLAVIQEQLGEIQPALRNYEQALEYARQSGYRTGEATLEVNLSNLQRRAGLVSLAIEHGASALELARQVEDPMIEMTALENLGLAHAASGRHDRAAALLTQALNLARDAAATEKQVQIELDLIDAQTRDGAPDEQVRECLDRVVELARRIEAANWSDLMATVCRLKGRLMSQTQIVNHLSGRDYLKLSLDFAIQSQNIFDQRDALREILRWSTPMDALEDVQKWDERYNRIESMIQVRPEADAPSPSR